MGTKKAKGKEGDISRRYQDLIEIARLVSTCMNRDYLIKTCLDHLSQRLGKRARCVLMERDELKLTCWVGKYDCPIEKVPVCKESIVWEVVKNRVPVNLTDIRQTEGYRHTLSDAVKIKAIIPIWYVHPVTQEENKVGALIVDSGKEGSPISSKDFDYLKVVGELIGAAVGRAELVEHMIESIKKNEVFVCEIAHNFRNRLAPLGGFTRRIEKLTRDAGLANEARYVYQEAKALETHLEKFEKNMALLSREWIGIRDFGVPTTYREKV